MDKRVSEYKNKLPFTESVMIQIDDQKIRVKNKFASLMICDGQMGCGKSTLAVEIVEYYQGKAIDYENQYAMGGEEFIEKIERCINKNLPILIYDEGGDFSSRGAVTKFNKTLNRVFETIRAFKIAVIICLPCLKSLDNHLFINGVPRILFHCKREPNKNYSSIKVYDLYCMHMLRGIMSNNRIPPQLAYGKVSPNTWGFFKPLSSHKQNELDKISRGAKKDIYVKNVINNKDLVSMDDIATYFYVTKRRVRDYVKTVKNMKYEIHHRKKYFPKKILEIIQRRYFKNG